MPLFMPTTERRRHGNSHENPIIGLQSSNTMTATKGGRFCSESIGQNSMFITSAEDKLSMLCSGLCDIISFGEEDVGVSSLQFEEFSVATVTIVAGELKA
ncbi:hypothetical protein Ancab_039340 [Ancistrocladus abbreviatus]